MPEPSFTLNRLNTLEDRISKQEALSLKNGGGDGTSNGMESRVAKVEAGINHILITLKDIKDDFREMRKNARADFLILGGISISSAVGLAGLMAHGFHWF